ncbi:unnamed protein product, partial [Timema podura]|nr:unnamed protein product [Timema podura]
VGEETFGEDSLATLEDLIWLNDVTNGSDTLRLPVGVNGTEEIFRLGVNETEPTLVACSTTFGVTGVCRHLANCPLQTFKEELLVYLSYFCSIGRKEAVRESKEADKRMIALKSETERKKLWDIYKEKNVNEKSNKEE